MQPPRLWFTATGTQTSLNDADCVTAGAFSGTDNSA
jgi:hypothetical protein